MQNARIIRFLRHLSWKFVSFFWFYVLVENQARKPISSKNYQSTQKPNKYEFVRKQERKSTC